MTTVLVTGGAGFIGSHLADRLLAEDHRVIAVDDLSTGRIANLAEARGYGKAYTFFNMDVRADGLSSLFERHRPEVVFHLAAQAGVRPSLEDPVRDASVNIMGTLNVLECAARVEARKSVYAASGGTVYGEPKRLPAKETTAQGSVPAEPLRHLEESRLGLLLLLSAVPRGGLHRVRARERLRAPADPQGEAGVISVFAGKMLAGERPTIYGDGNQTRDYVFVDDVVHAFVQAVERGSGKLVNVGTGLETSVNALYSMLADIIGFTEEPEHGPLPPGELRRSVLDISLASRAIAWKPWTHLEDGLADTVAYLKGV